MVHTYRTFRLVIEVICSLLLLALVAVPMAVAAFTVSVYMGVPLVCMLALGIVKRIKYNT